MAITIEAIGIASYPQLDAAVRIRRKGGREVGDPRYSLSVYCAPEYTNLNGIGSAIGQLLADKFPGVDPSRLNVPLHWGPQKYPNDENARDRWVLKTSSRYRPRVVNINDQDIPNERIRDEVYPGCMVEVVCTLDTYDQGEMGVACYLNRVRKVGEGARIGGGGPNFSTTRTEAINAPNWTPDQKPATPTAGFAQPEGQPPIGAVGRQYAVDPATTAAGQPQVPAAGQPQVPAAGQPQVPAAGQPQVPAAYFQPAQWQQPVQQLPEIQQPAQQQQSTQQGAVLPSAPEYSQS